MSGQTIGAISGRFGTNSGAEPERGEGFGEVIRFGVEGGEDTEDGGVGAGVSGRAFGCSAGFGLSGKEGIDCGDVGGEVVGLETAGFGFFAW